MPHCRVLLLALLCGTLAACRSQKETAPPAAEPLATIEVGAAPDAAATTEADSQSHSLADESFAGVLPGGFPADLPIYQPSSLVDFGPGEGGFQSVTLRTSDSAATVRSRYLASLRAAGWSSTGEESHWRKGQHELQVEVVDARPGTRLRLSYRSQ